MTYFRRLLAMVMMTELLFSKTAHAVDPNVDCFNNAGTLSNYGPNIYQTQSLCTKQCTDLGFAVWATTQGRLCYCGNEYPTTGGVPYDMYCTTKCLAWPDQFCGGTKAWTVGYTSNNENLVIAPVSSESPDSTTSSSSSQSSSSGASSSAQSTPTIMSTVIPSPTTVIVTGSGKPTSASSPALNANLSSSPISASPGASKAGIAAGVVVGVIAGIAIGVGLWLLYRRRKRLDAEEEYRAAVSAKEFISSARKPELDQRLEPAMLQKRRLSDGSIADNQDFSRRILKITNPDD